MSSRVKLLDETTEAPIDEPMPLDCSLKWISSSEDKVNALVDIFFTQTAYTKCVEHTASHLDNEVGGVLVGELRVDSQRNRSYIVIQDIIPALFTAASGTHVTFTHDTLVDLNKHLENDHPGKRIVGWYHSHPRLGVFLSGHDVWIQKHLFSDSTQVALVVDPEYDKAGFFCWQDDQVLDPARYVGFYELSDFGDESIIEWNNLSPVVEEFSAQDNEGGEK